MDIQNQVDAVIKALMQYDTEAIKDILRQGPCTDYMYDHSRLYEWIFRLIPGLNAYPPEDVYDVNDWRLIYNGGLHNILLHLAAKISDYELAGLLLGRGADVASTDIYGRTALHVACEKKSLEIIKLLLDNSSAYILDFGDFDGRTPLDIACRYSSTEVVQFLLLQGSSAVMEDTRRCNPLMMATSNTAEYATPIASLLLDAGANINHSYGPEGSVLLTAVINSSLEMPGAANSSASQNYSYKDLCMLLIDRGCDVNAVNSEGETALHIAVKTKQEDLIRKLLISGSDIDRRNVSGFTPLQYACIYGNQRLVDLLILSGSNLRAQDWEQTLIVFQMLRSLDVLNEQNIQLLNYVVYASKQCLTLKDLCYITLRRNIRHVEQDAVQLGLPPLLVKRLQLKD